MEIKVSGLNVRCLEKIKFFPASFGFPDIFAEDFASLGYVDHGLGVLGFLRLYVQIRSVGESPQLAIRYAQAKRTAVRIFSGI